MSYKPSWVDGGWLTICDACGRKFKESELRKRWDGLMVCRGDWEVRQPQDYVRGVADIQAPPYVRPEQANRFVSVGVGGPNRSLNTYVVNTEQLD